MSSTTDKQSVLIESLKTISISLEACVGLIDIMLKEKEPSKIKPKPKPKLNLPSPITNVVNVVPKVVDIDDDEVVGNSKLVISKDAYDLLNQFYDNHIIKVDGVSTRLGELWYRLKTFNGFSNKIHLKKVLGEFFKSKGYVVNVSDGNAYVVKGVRLKPLCE